MTEQRKILVIINPTSGQMKSKRAVFDIIDYFSQVGVIPTVLSTTKRGDATTYVLQNAAEYDVVVCCGGDGTLNEVITGMMQMPKQIPIGFVPCGTTNDMARSLQLPYRSTKKCVRLILSGQPHPFDVGRYCKERYFNYVASFGAFTRVSYNTPQWLKHMLGHAAYVLDGIMSLGEIKPYHMRIETDYETFQDQFIFGAVTNSLSVAGIVRLREKDVKLDDGLFEVILIRNPETPAELQRVLNGVLRLKFDEKYVRFLHTKRIHIESEEMVSWTLDGEYGGSHTDVLIENCHHAVSIISNKMHRLPPPEESTATTDHTSAP